MGGEFPDPETIIVNLANCNVAREEVWADIGNVSTSTYLFIRLWGGGLVICAAVRASQLGRVEEEAGNRGGCWVL